MPREQLATRRNEVLPLFHFHRPNFSSFARRPIEEIFTAKVRMNSRTTKYNSSLPRRVLESCFNPVGLLIIKSERIAIAKVRNARRHRSRRTLKESLHCSDFLRQPRTNPSILSCRFVLDPYFAHFYTFLHKYFDISTIDFFYTFALSASAFFQ